jgi:hypothetical protein
MMFDFAGCPLPVLVPALLLQMTVLATDKHADAGQLAELAFRIRQAKLQLLSIVVAVPLSVKTTQQRG